jgi:hypothetical protein
MNDLKINLPYLEGLTTAELSKLADSFDIDIPPGLDRNLIIGELLEFAPCLSLYQNEIAANVTALEQPKPTLVSKSLIELPTPSLLPKHYGFTFIDVLVRDPFWIFVFWEVSAADRKKYEKNADFEGYKLRVRLHNSGESKDALFMASVGIKDSSRYINFPSESRYVCDGTKSCSFVVDLCAVCANEKNILVTSGDFCLPAILPLPGEAAIYEDSMMLLSGLCDLEVLRTVGSTL